MLWEAGGKKDYLYVVTGNTVAYGNMENTQGT